VKRVPLYFLLTAVAAFLLGHFGNIWTGLALFIIGLSVHLAIYVRNFSRLERWSHEPRIDAILEGDGEWDPVFHRIYLHEKDLLERIAHLERDVAQLIAAAHVMNDGIVLLDGEFRIQFCNRTAERQLGINSAIDLGASIANIVRQPSFIDHLEKGEFVRPLVLRLSRHYERVLSIYLFAYADDHWLLQVKDITQTDRLDNMRRDFVANVSHELRTPLTVLSGFVETLQEIELDSDSRRHYLQLMGEQSKRMLSIIQDLLTLSSIESAPPPEDQPVDMANLVNKLYRDAIALSAGRHDIRLVSEGQGDLLGAESELVSALANLVSNAIRYTPDGGMITLIWKISPGEGAEFSVQDSGIGIAPEHIPRLTERFYRVDRGRSRDVGGTGLGLAIVKHALNRHQATLEITSKPGEGSLFSARFPASRVTGL
jgi:two-component system phosphate regulon sensor histidine kinase PhoR